MNAHVSEFGVSVNQISIVVLLLALLYVGFAVGAPWLLYDAPPSVQDVLASSAYCDAQAANPLGMLR